MSNQTKDQAGEIARFTPLKPMEEVLAENKAFMHASMPYRLRESLEFELAAERERIIKVLEGLKEGAYFSQRFILDQAIERIKR